MIRRKYIDLPKRDVDGVLLIDKPINVFSSVILNRVKKIFHANKAGHTGTLDLLATGMLPICFGKATKLAQHLLNSDKQYRVVVQLGISTNTFDAKGKIVRITPVQYTMYQLKKCLESFTGKSKQIPPKFSSVKYRGVPLYKYALKNVEVPRYARDIYIYGIHICTVKLNIIELIIHCSKGTYIRGIINDLGECLGCGAHVVELRRLSVGKCMFDSMINIKALEDIVNNSSFSNIEVLKILDNLLIPITTMNLLY